MDTCHPWLVPILLGDGHGEGSRKGGRQGGWKGDRQGGREGRRWGHQGLGCVEGRRVVLQAYGVQGQAALGAQVSQVPAIHIEVVIGLFR